MLKDTFNPLFSEDTLFNDPSNNIFEGAMSISLNNGALDKISNSFCFPSLGGNTSNSNYSQNNIQTRKIGANQQQHSIGFQLKKGASQKLEEQSDLFSGKNKNKETSCQLFEDHILDSVKQVTGCSLNLQTSLKSFITPQPQKNGSVQGTINERGHNNNNISKDFNQISSNSIGFYSSNPFKNHDLMTPASSSINIRDLFSSNFPQSQNLKMTNQQDPISPVTPPMQRNQPQMSFNQVIKPIKPKITSFFNNNSNVNQVSFSNMLNQNTNRGNNLDFEDGIFANESLSAMWNAKPEELNSQPRQTNAKTQIAGETLTLEQGLKQHLNSNKKLLGESSFHQNHIQQTTFHSATKIANQNNSIDDEKDQEKSSRGLRNLSLKVKQIVVQEGTTSYKVVADMLVEELRGQVNDLNSEEVTKDEQNIKRRVYDALNVLIAANVIEKKGKFIRSCPKSMLDGRCLKTENWKNVKSIESQLEQKQQQLKDKQNKVNEYVTKLLALKNLIQRNEKSEKDKITQQCSQSLDFLNNIDQVQEMSQRMQAMQDQTCLKDKLLLDYTENTSYSQQNNITLNSSILHFPLLFVHSGLSASPNSRIIIKMSGDQKSMKLFCKEQMTVLGDLDILIKLKMDSVDLTFAKKHLKEDFFQEFYLPNLTGLKNLVNDSNKRSFMEIEYHQ